MIQLMDCWDIYRIEQWKILNTETGERITYEEKTYERFMSGEEV